MFYLAIVVLVCIELLAWRKYHDIKSPALLYGILWIVSLLNIRSMSVYSEVTDSALLIICVGAIIFQFGFRVGTHIKVDRRQYTITANNSAMKWMIFFLVAFAMPVVVQYVEFIRSYGGSFYSAIGSAETSLGLSTLFDYYRKIVQFLFLCFSIVYWTQPIYKRKQIRVYVLALFVIATLATISVPTRNSILFFVLPLVMIWYCTHHTKNRRIVFTLLIASVGFLLIFYIISTGKYWYMYAASGASRLEIIKQEIQTYLSGSIGAFSSTWQEHSFTRNGANTFRLFVALDDAVFGTTNAVPLINEFTTLVNGQRTNVYTFYDFYLRDFGLVYAFIIQFILSVAHGINYSKMKKGNLFSIFMFSMLSYPLIMQFFQDQYFALLSTWIQIIIVGSVVLKSGLFFRKEYKD